MLVNDMTTLKNNTLLDSSGLLTGTSSQGQVVANNTQKDSGRTQFLNLLITQLKNQDPTSPMDNMEFTAQLAQFSSLEQLFMVNENLEKMGSSETESQNSFVTGGYVNFLGKTVNAFTDELTVEAGKDSAISFSLPGNAKDVQLNLVNQKGETVYSENLGYVESGVNQVTLKSNTTPAGNFRVEITGKGADNGTVEGRVLTEGVVTGVNMSGSGASMTVNGKLVEAKDIFEVSL